MNNQDLKIGIIGCGWLGLPLGEELVKKGYQVNGTSRSIDKFPRIRKVGINPYCVDLSNIDSKAINSFLAIDKLIITIPPGKQSTPLKSQISNLLDYIKQENRSIEIIYISSTSVYRDSNAEVVEEDAAYIATPRSGVVMLELEDLFNDYSDDRLILRFGGLFGPDREAGRFLAGRTGLSGRSNPVNMIHLDDCIGIISYLIENNIKTGTYNACSPIHPPKEEFYQLAAEKIGIELEPNLFSNETAPFKKVSSAKLLEKGFIFRYPNPMEAL